MIHVEAAGPVGETARFRDPIMIVSPSPMGMVLKTLLLLFLFSQLFRDFDIIVENCSDDRNHVGLNNPSANALCAPNSYVNDTLESQVPFPHVHHIFASSLFQNAYQALDPSIDGQDISNTSRGCSEVGEVVQRVDERQCRGAIESSSVIQGSGDGHRCLVDIGYAEIDFPHDGPPNSDCVS